MLSAWFRIKYPNVVAGSIAASAPIWGLPLTSPQPDDYAVAISRGVSAVGGATDTCFDNLAAAMVLLHEAGKTATGRTMLSDAFNTCSPLGSDGEVDALLGWAQDPWFELAEGNYPFPSQYITYSVRRLIHCVH
jgi:lysosomal Pro-X carboxypeptidase